MKTLYPFKAVLFLIGALIVSVTLNAQHQTLEFVSASGPSGNGGSISNQAITFQENIDNPSGSSYIPYATPTLTATYSLSNQQYALTTTQNPKKVAVTFGNTVSTSSQGAGNFSLFSSLNALGSASSSAFTSASTETPGTGISATNNYGVEIFNSAMGLYNAGSATNGRYYTADLTITFSSPVSNPVIHVSGLGGQANFGGGSSLGLTTEMELQTTGVTLSKLSGSSELDVNSTQILNSATHPASTTGSGAASGSVVANGSNITTLVFKLYLRGDGGLSNWSNGSQHVGDGFMIGASMLVTSVILPVNFANFTAVAMGKTSQLKWATAQEDNSDHFDVEYSTDGNEWKSIGTVAAAGTSSMEKDYAFTHTDPVVGDNYYRLKEVDRDGQAMYSKVCVVDFHGGASSKLSFYPNPVKDRVTITNSDASLQSVTVMTFDGKELQQNNHFVSGESMDMSRYPSGIYLLVIRNAGGNAEVLKIMKN